MIKYSDEVIKILKSSEKEAHNLLSKCVSTEHILLSVLKSDSNLNMIFKSNRINYQEFKEVLNLFNQQNCDNYTLTYTPLLKKLILSSAKNSKLELNDLIINILENNNSIANKLLNYLKVDIYTIIKQIKNIGNMEYGINLNKEIINEKIFGRDKELNKLIEILSKKYKNNAILIGEAGVGKTAIVEALAQKINNNDVPNNLMNKEIISISMSSLLSGTKYRGEFEEKIEKLISNLENSKYILFIDEIHTLLKAGSSEGSINAGNILKPYLTKNKIKCIGATTISEYNDTIKRDKALSRRFETIYVCEPNKDETKEILLKSKKYYEDYHNIKISNRLIDSIIYLSTKYLPNKKEPDRSLDIMDMACAKMRLLHDKENDFLALRNNYIINNDFERAKITSKKLSRCKKVALTMKIINECYEKYDITNKIGFKIP